MAEVEKVNQPEVDYFTEFEGEQLKRLTQLYAESNKCSDADPLELQMKLTYYGDIHEIMGDLEAVATGQEKLSYAYRQEVNARTYMHRRYVKDSNGKDTDTKLTAKERDAVAELAVKKYRRDEARFAQESKKWRNRRDSVLEQINIMKRRQDLFSDQWDKANLMNGYSGGR